MKRKTKAQSTPTTPIRESWEIWNYLISNAGLDNVYYDNEFLNGNSSFNGLSQHLGFKVDKTTITDQLKKYKVSAERFIGAFFKVLQPYAQMMNDLCVFFSDHKISGTNESLKIVFDFGNVTDQLDFNLENFRSTLSNYSAIRKKVTFYHLPDVWSLHGLFRDNDRITRPQIKDRKAARWLEMYRNGKYQKPDLTFNPTRYKDLDLQLQRVLDLWTDYVTTCRNYTENVKELWSKLNEVESQRKGTDDQTAVFKPDDDIATSWSLDNLRAESDHWSATMIELFYGRLQAFQKLSRPERDTRAHDLEVSLRSFFEGLPKTEKEFDDVVEELIELLNMPVWKKRYELFSAWVLAAMDQALAGYDRKVNEQGGVLLLSFKPTHLMTIQSTNGPFELWAENRTLLSNPVGHGRKHGIQPDYTIYQPTIGDPNDCIACVEVKQYKKASSRNFGNALNDYANGLPKASIFLTNYGPVPASLPLLHPTRSAYFGEVRPGAKTFDTFKSALIATLPLAKHLSSAEVLKLELPKLTLEKLYVDVSGSMDKYLFKTYIKACLTALLERKVIQTMTAFDDRNQHDWSSPCEADLESLLYTHFYGGGDHDLRSLITDSRSLIITDRTGAQEIYESDSRPLIIMLEKYDAELWIYMKDEDTYVHQATETLDTLANTKKKGFPGWLYSAEG